MSIEGCSRKGSEDTRVTIQEIADTLDLAPGSVSNILKYHRRYRKVCARWVPHILTPENRKTHVAYLTAVVQVSADCDPRDLDNFVTGDETCVHLYELERKAT